MLLRALTLLLFLPGLALGQATPPQGMPAQVSATVNDFADLLPPEAEARVAAALTAAQAETGVQIVLVTLQSLAANGGADWRLQDYAKTLFNTWKIGDAERNDGILILVLPGDRTMRIALGSGYDSVWDNRAQRVIDRSFLPAFRADRYAEGIATGVAATVDQIARPFAALESAAAATEDQRRTPPPLILFGLCAAIIGAVALKGRLAGVVTRLRPCPNCHARSLRRESTVAIVGEDEAGTIRTRCTSCGWKRDTPQVRKAGVRQGAPGSGRTGGGRSSGGGASGKW